MDFLRRFRDETSGNILIMFALMLLPILGVVGAAVDFTVKAQEVTRLQTALDNVVLALAHEPMAKDDAELNALKVKVNTFLSENYKTPSGAAPKVTKITRNKGSFSIEAIATIDTSFMKVADIKTMDISVSSTAVWGTNKAEIVMALDNTGSMASNNKMDELIDAANELLNIIEETQIEPGQFKVGIVPFATTVRVPVDSSNKPLEQYKTAEWIRFDKVNYTVRVCDTNSRGQQVNCRNETRQRDFDKNAWQGCIWDRDKTSSLETSNDVRDLVSKKEEPVPVGYEKGEPDTLYPAIETCPSSERNLQPIVPMSSDFSLKGPLRTAINAMTPAGNTNVTIGVAWALSLLSKQAPFTESVETDEQPVIKYMIILTDGQNTQNRWSNSQSSIDKRTEQACDNAVDAGTTFSIRVIDGNAALLKKCASTEDNYYEVDSASELKGVFEEIANEITKLRLGS